MNLLIRVKMFSVGTHLGGKGKLEILSFIFIHGLRYLEANTQIV